MTDMKFGLVARRRDYIAARKVAASIARDQVEEIAPLGYEAISETYGDGSTKRIATGTDGREYQVSIEALKLGRGNDLHLFVAVDDGGWMAYYPPADGVDIPHPH